MTAASGAAGSTSREGQRGNTQSKVEIIMQTALRDLLMAKVNPRCCSDSIQGIPIRSLGDAATGCRGKPKKEIGKTRWVQGHWKYLLSFSFLSKNWKACKFVSESLLLCSKSVHSTDVLLFPRPREVWLTPLSSKLCTQL